MLRYKHKACFKIHQIITKNNTIDYKRMKSNKGALVLNNKS